MVIELCSLKRVSFFFNLTRDLKLLFCLAGFTEHNLPQDFPHNCLMLFFFLPELLAGSECFDPMYQRLWDMNVLWTVIPFLRELFHTGFHSVLFSVYKKQAEEIVRLIWAGLTDTHLFSSHQI